MIRKVRKHADSTRSTIYVDRRWKKEPRVERVNIPDISIIAFEDGFTTLADNLGTQVGSWLSTDMIGTRHH